MLDWQETAVRNAFRDATWETVVEERKRYAKRTGTVAEEMRELLQTILEEKLAHEDADQSSAEWSKSQEPKKRPLTAAEKKQREEARLERETQGGRFLPRPKEPESPYKNQTEYEQARRMNPAEYKAFLASQKPPRD